MSGGRRLRLLANSLTLSRCAIAASILIIGVSRGDLGAGDRLGLIVGLNIAGWTTDVIDGWAARRSGSPSPVWADVDQAADLSLQWATAYALGVARLVSLYWITLYLLLTIFAMAVRPSKNLIQISSLPMVVLPAFACLRHYPLFTLLYFAWAVCAAALFWSRLCSQAVAFIDRLPPGPRGWFSGVRKWMSRYC
ncbi:MAG: CDP-alcohol phosphatidyltransferase family protein [Chloroflexota bacterium]